MADSAARDAAPHLHIHCLGEVHITLGTRTIYQSPHPPKKAQTLLLILALAPHHRLTLDVVAGLLWPMKDHKQAIESLYVTIHKLRRMLEPSLARAADSAYLVVHQRMVELRPATLRVDGEAFEQAYAVAHSTQAPADYAAALALYTGDMPVEERSPEWMVSRRERMRHYYQTLLIEAARAAAQCGQLMLAMDYLDHVLRRDAIHEEAHLSLMRLYVRVGLWNQALGQYERLREALQRERGIEPSTQAQQLYRAVLARDPRLEAEYDTLPQRTVETDIANEGPPGRSFISSCLLSNFVGREQEMKQVKSLLLVHRLVTLHGPGGCGKTQLATHLADALRPTYGNVWIVPLECIEDPRLVAQAVADEIGIREASGESLFEPLIRALRTRRGLLVLDNCEHLGNTPAQVAEKLLGACPQLSILTTSRQPLGAREEYVWPVPPLRVPAPHPLPPLEHVERYSAVQVFVHRARQRNQAFALTAETAPLVAHICSHLEGLPLAIELAAACLPVLSLERLAARLDDALTLLVSGDSTAPVRQKTLRATLDWSFSLLSSPEKELLRRLAVFTGTWSLKAAEAICAGGVVERRMILDLLGQLVEKSLVVAEPQGKRMRYRLLETTRQYAAERLSHSLDASAIRQRHAEWYLALAEYVEPRLTGPHQQVWLRRLDTHHSNLRAALTWALDNQRTELGLRLCGALWRYWWIRAYLSQGRHWLERARTLDVHEGEHTLAIRGARAKALCGAGMLAAEQGDSHTAMTYLEESVSLRRGLKDPVGIAESLSIAGMVAYYQADLEHATALLEESLALCEARNDLRGIADAKKNLGTVAYYQEDYTCAEVLLNQSLRLRQEIGDLGGMAFSLINLANVAYKQGCYTLAEGRYLRSLALRWKLGAKTGIAACLEGLVVNAQAMGQPQRAAWLLGVDEALRESIGMRVPSSDQALYEAVVAAVRETLGDDGAFEEASAAGHSLPWDHVLAVTLAASDTTLADDTTPSTTGLPMPLPFARHLTQREREIVVLINRGLSKEVAATQLRIAPSAVEDTITSILTNLSPASRD
ncbi:MAG: tetratricopeptide repeat protein [Ktedonobacterales bacterium]|nr:tetratricopeptide repeat protein [Ktedonobacterales bacterium]